MITALVAVAATSLFPCSVEYSVQAPGYEQQITAALGVYSALSGTAFTVGDGGIHFIVRASLLPSKGVETLAMWSPMSATISLLPASKLPVGARQRVVLHELGHAYWQDHNDEADSVMYRYMNPQHTVTALSVRDQQRIRDAGCRDYTNGGTQ